MAEPVASVSAVVFGLARWLRAERLRGLELVGYLTLKLGSDLLVPWSTKLLVDDVIPGRDGRRLLAWCALIGVSWLVGSAATYRRTLVSGVLAARVLALLRAKCLAKLHALPLRTLRKSASGDLVALIALDVENLHDVVDRVLPALIFETASLLLVFALALTLNGYLALFVVGVGAPLFARLYFRANHKLGEASRALQDEQGALTGVVSEQLANANDRVRSLIDPRLSGALPDETTEAEIKKATDSLEGFEYPELEDDPND